MGITGFTVDELIADQMHALGHRCNNKVPVVTILDGTQPTATDLSVECEAITSRLESLARMGAATGKHDPLAGDQYRLAERVAAVGEALSCR